MSQVEHVLEQVESTPDSDNNADLDPQVPFQSDLQLTREQEDRMCEFASQRMLSLEQELGRDVVKSQAWWTDGENLEEAQESWMGKREMYENIYRNDVDWRPNVLGGIFQKSNLVVPLSRRICKQMVARANNYFFGSDPWFSVKAESGANMHNLAEKIDHFAKFKLFESKSKSHKENAVELAFIRGECVMKSVYERDVDYYYVTADILIDINGEPILDSAGGYIFKNDKWVPLISTDAVTGEERDMGVSILERDPEVRKPEMLLWKKERIRQKAVQFSGAKSQPVYFKDFLCPLKAPSVDKADFVSHLYDMGLMELAEMYRHEGVFGQDEDNPSDSWDKAIKAIDLLRDLTNNDPSPKAAKDQPRDNDEWGYSSYNSIGAEDPVVEVAECHFYFDADNDGIREHVYMVMDKKTGRPIFYEYMANMTPDGKRPFTVIRPSDVDGRWYGVGAMEMFETTQEIVDLLVNRWNYSQSKSGRVTFWNPHMTMEGDRDPNLKLNDGATYTLKPNVTPKDVLDYVTLPDIKHEAIQNLFQFFLQIAMNESGVQHANDANMVGLDQAKLATGIRNIEKSGMEMFSIYISKLMPGIQESLEKEVNLLFANLDEEEYFNYYNSGEMVEEIMSPEDVQDLRVKVNVLLTRYRGEQVVQQSTTAIQAIEKFYQQPPLVQQQTLQLYQMFIKALDINVDAEQIIQPIPPEAMGAAQGAGRGGDIDAEAATQAVADKQPTQPNPNL